MYTCNYMHNYNYASHNVLLNCQTSKVFCCGAWGGGGGGGGVYMSSDPLGPPHYMIFLPTSLI